MESTENMECAKKHIFQTAMEMTYGLTELLKAVDVMGWTDELVAYAEEDDKKEDDDHADS